MYDRICTQNVAKYQQARGVLGLPPLSILFSPSPGFTPGATMVTPAAGAAMATPATGAPMATPGGVTPYDGDGEGDGPAGAGTGVGHGEGPATKRQRLEDL